MITPDLFSGLSDSKRNINVLCLGAHCDDIEIGCGGTVLELLKQRTNINLTWVVFSSTPARKREAEIGAEKFGLAANLLDIRILNFTDGYLPYNAIDVKSAIEDIKLSVPVPDLIFTHYRADLHQDHRFISELTWNTFRNHQIFEYEIPKWDGDLGNPNAYIPIGQEQAEHKIELLQEIYNSQSQKKWFTDDLFHSLMRIRGMECNSNSTLAEAFYIRKSTFRF